MRRRDYYWSLYHDAEFNQIDNLRTDQVEAVFAAIPKTMKSQWWIWRDGFDEWKPFEDFPDLLLSLRKTEEGDVKTPPVPVGSTFGKETPKAPVEEKKEDTASGTQVVPTQKTPEPTSGPVKFDLESDDEVELTLMRTGMGEDRNNFRFDTSLDVRVVVGSKSFANKTVNISLKGMQLKQPLPKNLPRYFNIEIHRKDTVIPVVCSEVKNADGSPSNRVKIEVNDHASALLAILLS